MQKEPTPAKQVHRFCSLLVHSDNDDVFHGLISAMNKVNKRHIADELLRIEKEGYVHDGNIKGIEKKLIALCH